MDDSKIKVLVVEDHHIARKIAVTILEGLYCDVDVAVDGLEALTKLHSNQYQLLLVDIGLPCIDGFELVKRIRDHELAYHHKLPIIALTAHTDTAYKMRCVEAGMNECLSKPLTTEDARVILDTFIQKCAS